MPFPAALIPLLASAGGAAVNAAAGGVGGAAASGDRERSAALLDGILKEYSDLPVPELQKIIAETLGPSAMEGVNTDPRLRQEQQSVLEKMGRLSETGDNAETKAALFKVLQQVGRQEGAGRNAILQNMRSRGVSGSGAELAAQLSNQQASAERAQEAGLQQGAEAQKRMLAALTGRGQLAGQMRSQDFGENSAKAQARDAIQRYNAGARTDVNRYNSQLPAQNYAMQLQKLAGKGAAASAGAKSANESADRTANTFAGIGNAANTAGTGLAAELGKKEAEQPVWRFQLKDDE